MYVMYLYTCVVTEPAFQYEGGVRLVGGPYSSEGILEVFIFNMWYTMCTESLSETAATAVCTQLGYTNIARTTRRFVSKIIMIYYIHTYISGRSGEGHDSS